MAINKNGALPETRRKWDEGDKANSLRLLGKWTEEGLNISSTRAEVTEQNEDDEYFDLLADT